MPAAMRTVLVPGVIWLVTAAFIIAAYRLGPVARAMPLLVGWITLVLVTLDIVARTDTAAGRALTSALNPAHRFRLKPKAPAPRAHSGPVSRRFSHSSPASR